MRRRSFIGVLGAAAVWPLAAHAQQAGKVPTIGFLGGGSAASQRTWAAAFVQRLRELGWVEGRTVKPNSIYSAPPARHCGESKFQFVMSALRPKADMCSAIGMSAKGHERVITDPRTHATPPAVANADACL